MHETIPPGELTFRDVLSILEIVRQATRFGSVEVLIDGTSIYAAAHGRLAPPATKQVEAAAPSTSVITAPALGVLYWDGDGNSPGGLDAVGRIDTLGQITSVNSRREGVVVEVLAEHGAFVEYGQPLLRIAHP